MAQNFTDGFDAADTGAGDAAPTPAAAGQAGPPVPAQPTGRYWSRIPGKLGPTRGASVASWLRADDPFWTADASTLPLGGKVRDMWLSAGLGPKTTS